MNLKNQWRNVVGFEGLYSVSSDGLIYSHSKRALKSFYLFKDRYAVNLWKNGKQYTRRVHVLVAEAFIGPRPKGLIACHNNGIATDNNVENIRWDTSQNNALDTVKHGKHHNAIKTHCKHGHEFTSDNLVPSKIKVGRRNCLTCSRGFASKDRI